MAIQIVNGDILNVSDSIICQQVNCRGVMGAGLAKQIRDKYPTVYPDYKRYASTDSLGTCLFVPVADGNIVANLFGQLDYGRGIRYTQYAALEQCLRRVAEVSRERCKPVAIPFNLGCGLAGGDWTVVLSLIKQILTDTDTTIYRL